MVKAIKLAFELEYHRAYEAAAELRRLHEINQELLEVLKSTGLFLHHCWCDVPMNEYSFKKLNLQMEVVDTAIAKATGEALV